MIHPMLFDKRSGTNKAGGGISAGHIHLAVVGCCERLVGHEHWVCLLHCRHFLHQSVGVLLPPSHQPHRLQQDFEFLWFISVRI